MEPMRADMVIEAPRHVVWDALVDSDAVVEWNPAIREIQRRSDEPLGMGATRRCFMSPSGWMTETVVEWDEGSLVGYSIRDASPLKNGLIRFELTDQATATRLKASFRYSVRLGPLGPVIDRLIVHRQLTAAWERSLEGLRLYTESLTRKGAGGHTSIPQTAEQGEIP